MPAQAGELLTFDKEQLKGSLSNIAPQRAPALAARNPAHTAETAGIQLKEALLVGVVGNSFDDGTELACPKHWNWWWSSYGGMA